MGITLYLRLYGDALESYESLLFVREKALRSLPVQLAGAWFFVTLMIVSFVLLAYWLYSARHLMAASGEELTDAEMEPLRWDQSVWQSLWLLVMPAPGKLR